MIYLKIYYHFIATIKKIFFKIIYSTHIKFGKRTTFRKGLSVAIEDGGTIIIGNNNFFNNYCSLNCKKSIKIGDNCIFGENVKIYDHNHKFNKTNLLIKEQGYKVDDVKIGKNCWIGSNVVILKGVTIGNNVVIGAGCVVRKNVEDNMILRNNENYVMEKIMYR